MKHFTPLLLTLTLLSVGLPIKAIAGSSTSSTDATHPIVMQLAATQVANAQVANLHPFIAARKVPAVGGAGGPKREIFGFALASSLNDPTIGYQRWTFSLLSTVAFFGLHVNDDGTFASDSGSSVWNSSVLTGLLTAAHASGTKVVLSIILQDFSANTPHMCSALLHYPTTIANAVAEVKAKGVDGINLDYEGLNGGCGIASDPSWARHQFTSFVSSLRNALSAGAYLSVDTYASSAADPLGFFDVAAVAAYADSFFVMAYDLEYSNYARPPLNCLSFCLSPTAPLTGYYYNDTSTVAQYAAAVPASKVILGVPYYGRKGCVASQAPNGYPATGSVSADSYLDASSEATNPGPGFQPGSYVSHRDANDPAGQERWDTWFNTSLNCTRELYWDDVISLGNKFDLINTANLRGLGIWNLNYGGGSPELWNELSLKFGTTPTSSWLSLGGMSKGSGAVVATGGFSVDVLVRGTGDALWHRTWNGSAWTSWQSLGGVLTSAPVAVASGPTVEVLVRGTDNGLWHRAWNGTSWSAWTSLGGVLTSDPSAVSWGPNRIDVFARGTDNGLWHRWSNGTSWGGWESLGGVLTTGPKAASWGLNRLDVFVGGTDNHGIWQRAWNGTSWVSWRSLGGVPMSDAAVISPASNQIDVYVRGTDNGLWQDSWSGNSWSGWMSLAGVLTSPPTASSCSSTHVDVFVRGADNGFWQRGFNGAAWSGWRGLGGLWSGAPMAVCPSGAATVDLFALDAAGALWEGSAPGS